MKVRVIGASEQCWYSECIGQVFNAFLIPNYVYVFFSNTIYFYPEHIELIKTEEDGLIPSFTVGIA